MRYCRVGLYFVLTGISAGMTRAALCDGVSTASGTALASIRIASGLDKPCVVTAPPGDTHRIFIVEQDGRVRIVKDGALLATPYLDVSLITRSPVDAGDDEQGLLGLAFSPTYASDGLSFIFHTDNAGTSNLIARYHVSANPDVADSASRTLVLTIPHADFTNHNGGDIHFGPGDGYLYIGSGDGGSGCDAGGGGGNAQNTNVLLGKLLRIDVIPPPASQPYRIPPGQPGYLKPEIFSIGLRNPWRFSFDRLTRDLYIGDVGQNSWEEVDYVSAASGASGANFGWQNYEGLECPAPGCDAFCSSLAARISPVKVYDHSEGCAITGGYVYRGCRMPDLSAQGRYFYSDFCAGNVESFVISAGAATSELSLTAALSPAIGGATIDQITSWGEDAQGELYIADRGGEVFKLVPLLRNLEVSGTGAIGAAAPAELRLGKPDWTWEDLGSSSIPINFYRVYRHGGNGSGTFNCVFKTATVTPPARPSTMWPGGDPAVPGVGALYSYVVTAVRSTSPADESSPGRASSGVPRSLGTAVCP